MASVNLFPFGLTRARDVVLQVTLPGRPRSPEIRVNVGGRAKSLTRYRGRHRLGENELEGGQRLDRSGIEIRLRRDVTLRSTERTRPPGVLAWYRVYCILMQALSLAIIAGGILLIIFKEDLAAQVGPPELLLVFGIILIVLGSISDLAFFAALFLPRRRWAWIYHLLMLVLGGLILGPIAGLCSLAFSIPLF